MWKEGDGAADKLGGDLMGGPLGDKGVAKEEAGHGERWPGMGWGWVKGIGWQKYFKQDLRPIACQKWP